MNIKPTFEEVKRLSKNYKTVPISTEMVMNYTPVGIIKKVRAISSHCFLLESKEDTKKTGRYTFIGFEPKLEISSRDEINKILDEYKAPKLDYLPPFTGGLVGYFAYDFIKYTEPKLNLDAKDDGNFKDLDLMLFDKVIAFDNLEEKIILIANIQTDNLEDNFKKGVKELERIAHIIENQPIVEPELPTIKGEFNSLFSAEEYGKMVEKAKKYIIEGDIFQVVLSNRLQVEMSGSLLKPYEVLRNMNPSPYMFYFSSDNIEIAGASPETLVKLQDKKLSTFPLAGTRPRGKDEDEDKRLEEELLQDEKELSEHNMLVDLGRNDIGKISEFGSVKVENYMDILKFSHVMHIGSTVTGTIRDDKTALDAIDSVLPAGTLSGAPKIRAMEIINELENNKRGIYGGAIGYLDFTGNMDTCIAIRIAYKKNGNLYIRSGAGIVKDSDPVKEHQECLNKAKAVVTAVKMASKEA